AAPSSISPRLMWVTESRANDEPKPNLPASTFVSGVARAVLVALFWADRVTSAPPTSADEPASTRASLRLSTLLNANAPLAPKFSVPGPEVASALTALACGVRASTLIVVACRSALPPITARLPTVALLTPTATPTPAAGPDPLLPVWEALAFTDAVVVDDER